MSVPGFLVAFLYLLGGFCVILGIVLAGLSLAAPFAFRVNMLDVQALVVDLYGWLPWIDYDADRAGGIALAVTLLVVGVGIAALGAIMMALPGYAP